MRAQFTNRIRVIAVLVILVGLFFGYRLYILQVVNGSTFRERAEEQYVAPSANYFDRGAILFTPKDGLPFSAAGIDAGFTLAIVPDEVVRPAEAYETLSRYVELDSAEFLAKAAKKGDPYEELTRRVPTEVGNAIREEDIPGVRLYREQWRTYPAGTAAAHTIGFVGYGASDTLSGQYGLERFYDEALTKPDAGLYVNFFADIFTNVRSRLFDASAPPGANVVTSIEPTTQAFLEDLLQRYQDTWHAEEGGAIIMDPHTGAIIALAAFPTFDPNDVSSADPAAFANPLVERVYEFGSIMNPLTVAAGIDAGAITPETTYNDRGYAVYDGARISNFDGRGRGIVPMQEVLNQSLNTGVAFIVEELGTDAFRTYFERYGLREETGIDLPNEAEPLSANLDSPRTIEYVTASFGQGIAVTPVAMARSLATLANHGLVPAPRVATRLEYPGGLDKPLGWSPERRAVSEETAETVTGMLVEVVDTALRGGTVKIPELSVAAKTGTAQIARADERGYYDDRFLHSFFGYFPAYDARFFVFLYAVAPQGARYASETWTPPFMESVRFLTSYYEIEPDRVPRSQ
ncbi:MAG: peptidoglycan D,D-transpeptidase FtsI family protein [Candidatus Paceibacteria bacterium]